MLIRMGGFVFFWVWFGFGLGLGVGGDGGDLERNVGVDTWFWIGVLGNRKISFTEFLTVSIVRGRCEACGFRFDSGRVEQLFLCGSNNQETTRNPFVFLH